jgi:quercetin dioxygenase-like cupin family protein
VALSNPQTGERIDFVRDEPDVLEMEAVWPPGGRRTVPHAHPDMEERWTVLEGTAAFRVGGVERTAGEGETVVAARGVRHEAYNPGDAEVRVRIEMRPPLRWREFVERLFAGEDPAALLDAFGDEISV